jgi:hypothetical protein
MGWKKAINNYEGIVKKMEDIALLMDPLGLCKLVR